MLQIATGNKELVELEELRSFGMSKKMESCKQLLSPKLFSFLERCFEIPEKRGTASALLSDPFITCYQSNMNV
jgi:serine/threonine protein kinase